MSTRDHRFLADKFKLTHCRLDCDLTGPVYGLSCLHIRDRGHRVLRRRATMGRHLPPHIFSVREVPEHRLLHFLEILIRHSPDRLADAGPLKPLYRDGRKMVADSPLVPAILCTGLSLSSGNLQKYICPILGWKTITSSRSGRRPRFSLTAVRARPRRKS